MAIVGDTLFYAGAITWLSFWATRRRKQIQKEDGTHNEPRPRRSMFHDQAGELKKSNVYGALAGSIFGSMAWLVTMAFQFHDWITGVLTVGVSIATFLMSVRASLRNPQKGSLILFGTFGGLGFCTLLAINLRWNDWMAATVNAAPHNQIAHWIRLGLNLLLVLVYGIILISVFSRAKD